MPADGCAVAERRASNVLQFQHCSAARSTLTEPFYVAVEVATHIVLQGSWITAERFEAALPRAPGLLQSPETAIRIEIPARAKLMVDAAVRLLSLANQLAYIHKVVTLEFDAEDRSGYEYLNRIGFFDLLAPEVHVRPDRPNVSTAAIYQGGSSRLVEIVPLRPAKPDQSLPKRLEKVLVGAINNPVRQEVIGAATSTFLRELIGNVYEHSSTALDGFAVLQVYAQGNSARLAVSDSGLGLMDTIRPALPKHYPHLAKSSTPEILSFAFKHGISCRGPGRGGCGLKVCAEKAVTLGANLEVRLPQEAVSVAGKRGGLSRPLLNPGLPLIWGTHIVFDFKLD